MSEIKTGTGGTSISFLAHEATVARLERITKRATLALIAESVLLSAITIGLMITGVQKYD